MDYFKQFLQTFQDSYIQTFCDKKSGDKNRVRIFPMSQLKQRWDELQELNEQGAGVYFTPNPCKGGRKEENVTSIEWIYCDIDDKTKDEQAELIQKSPIYPDIINESSRGYHLLWKCHFSNKEKFELAIKGIIQYFGADPAISSTNEVLRFPGFFHMKNDPYRVSILNFNITGTDEQTMINLFPYNTPIENPTTHDFQIKHGVGNDDIAIIKDIPIKVVLDKLGVHYNRSNFIMDEKTVSSASINEKKNYINRFSGKPGSGSTIDAVMTYGNMQKNEAIKWLKCLAGIDEESKVIKSLDRKTDSKDPIDEVNLAPYTWGTDGLDEKITPIEKHHYIIFAGESGVGKTAYSFDMAIKNALLGHVVLYISLEMTTDNILTRICRDFAGISKSQWRDKNKITNKQIEIYKKKKKELLKIETFKPYGFPKNIEATCENIKKIIQESMCNIAFVDNLDLIVRNEKMNDLQNESYIAKFFMDMTNQIKIPTIVLHHIRKKGSNESKGKIGLDSIKGSSKITHNSDTVVVGARVAYEKDTPSEELAKFIIVQKKDRDFGIGGYHVVYFYKGSFYDTYHSKLDDVINENEIDDKENLPF